MGSTSPRLPVRGGRGEVEPIVSVLKLTDHYICTTWKKPQNQLCFPMNIHTHHSRVCPPLAGHGMGLYLLPVTLWQGVPLLLGDTTAATTTIANSTTTNSCSSCDLYFTLTWHWLVVLFGWQWASFFCHLGPCSQLPRIDLHSAAPFWFSCCLC